MDAKRVYTCRPTLTALPNGDALVACTLSGQVQIHRLDSRTGKRTLAVLTPPSCQKGRYAANVSPITRRDGAVFVFGSGMGNDGDEGCSWMARLRHLSDGHFAPEMRRLGMVPVEL
jgi:hypothetical protein